MIAKMRQRWWTMTLMLATLVAAITLISISTIRFQRSKSISSSSTILLGTPANGMLQCNNDGFQIQYPASWTCISQNPGVELDDTVEEPSTIVQVDLPDSNNSPAQLVSDEFARIQEQSGGNGLTKEPQPLQRSIGGETWIGSAAQLMVNSETIYVQIYAAVHDHQAYVITLFSTGFPIDVTRQSVFGTILNSFQFT